MKCISCGGEIPEGARVCPYCDVEVVANTKEPLKTQETLQPKDETEVKNEPVSLVGKRYEMHSSQGMNVWAIFRTRVRSVVQVGEDRLLISIKPDRMNVSPVIMLEDVLAIELKRKISPYYWVLIICAICACFTSLWFILLVLLFWWAGTNTKIIISQRNGVRVVMYSNARADAVAFKEDMKKITNIQ